MGRVRLPVLWLVLALCGGIFCGDILRVEPGHALLVCLGTWLALFGLQSFRKAWHPYLFLCVAFLGYSGFGLLTASLSAPENTPGHYIRQAGTEKKLWRVRLDARMRPSSFSRRWVGRIVQADSKRVRGRVLLSFPAATPDSSWQPADEIAVYGAFRPLPAALNPGQFDYALYMRHNGVPGQIRVAAEEFIHRARPPETLRDVLNRLRERFGQRIAKSGLHPDSSAILKALLLGDRNEIDPELRRDYQNAGVIHLLAISGLHVGMWYWLVRLLLSVLPRVRMARHLRFSMELFALWGYAALAGFSASVVRSSAVFSLWALASHIRRKGQSLHFLGLAALLMLGIINPFWVFQAGFQLSFFAVWGILAFYPFLNSFWPLGRGVGKRIGDLLAVSLAAQIGLLPISLFHFNQFPWLFLPGSLVLVPLLGIILALGFLLLVLSVLGWLPAFLPTALDAILGAQNRLVAQFGQMEAFRTVGIRWDQGHLLLAGIGLVCLSYALLHTRKTGPGRVLTRSESSRAPRGWKGAALAFSGLLLWSLLTDLQAHRQRLWIVPHVTAASGFWLREGTRLYAYWNSDRPDRPLQDYLRKNGLTVSGEHPLEQAYCLDDTRILRIDRSAVYPKAGYRPDILLLSDSPRLHLERVLGQLTPRQVVADGSNYYSDLKRWEASCELAGIPFHATAHQGAFILELKPLELQPPPGLRGWGQ